MARSWAAAPREKNVYVCVSPEKKIEQFLHPQNDGLTKIEKLTLIFKPARQTRLLSITITEQARPSYIHVAETQEQSYLFLNICNLTV
jgi:hypothetical protein